MDLTIEQFSGLPEFLKEQYQESDGVYKSVDSMKFATVKQTADKLDKELKAARGEFATLKETFDTEQLAKAEQLKLAKDKALEDATGKGEVSKIHELYEQKMADLEKRSYEKGKLEASGEYKAQSLAKDALSLRTNIAAKYALDDDCQSAMSMLLSGMIKAGDDSVGFYDAAGSALSITDSAEFEREIIKKSPMFKRLMKPEHTVNGGGMAGGGSSTQAAVKLSRSTMTATQKHEYAKEHGQQAFLKLPK